MSRIYPFLVSLLIAAGCVKAPVEADRWQSAPSDSSTPSSPADQSHQLLVEKYTGQGCVNCPTAASMLEKLEKLYPERLIVVSMHAAYTGQTHPELQSTTADSYAKAFRLPRAIPGVMIDRSPLSDGQLYSMVSSRWTSEITRALRSPASHSLSLTLTSPRGKTGFRTTVKVDGLTPEAKAKKCDLTLWLVEDVIAPQETAKGTDPAFLHHNVLRQELTKEVVELGKPYIKNFIFPADAGIDRSREKIVAFITDINTGRVLEARLQSFSSSEPSQPDEPSRPEEEKEKEATHIAFLDAASGKEIPAGSIVSCSPDRPLELLDGVAEVASPYLKLHVPSSFKGTLDVEVQATSSGVGRDTHGLRAVCLESCVTLETLASSYQLREYKPQSAHLIGVHYGLRKDFARKAGIYEVKLLVKQARKVLTSLIYRFTITPKDFAPAEKPEKPQPPKPDPTPSPSPTPTPPPPVSRDDIPEAKKAHVVAFDFTGQNCGYCYAALDNMNNAKAALGEYFHPVAIQSRSYRQGSDLLCEDYWMYDRFYHPSGFPNVFVANDKQKVYHSLVQGHSKQLMEQKPQVKMRFSVSNTPTHVTVSFKALPNNGKTPPKEVEVLFLLVQNNMVAFQINKSATYSHQHVLRRGLNNKPDPTNWEKWTWGNAYTYGSDFTATYRLEDARYPGSLPIVPKDCEVIALLLDKETKLVLNAAVVRLK